MSTDEPREVRPIRFDSHEQRRDFRPIVERVDQSPKADSSAAGPVDLNTLLQPDRQDFDQLPPATPEETAAVQAQATSEAGSQPPSPESSETTEPTPPIPVSTTPAQEAAPVVPEQTPEEPVLTNPWDLQTSDPTPSDPAPASPDETASPDADSDAPAKKSGKK